MIVVLEGVNGVGKSTYASALAERFSIPVCRPFRNGNSDLHWGSGSELEKKLGVLGVPVNTHVDDLYVADFLATFGVGAVLDRAVPSAVAYGILNGGDGERYGQPRFVSTLMGFWQQTLQKAPGPILYVWLRASYEVAKARCEGRWFPNKAEYQKLDKLFERLFGEVDLPKRQINTSDIHANDGVEAVCRALTK